MRAIPPDIAAIARMAGSYRSGANRPPCGANGVD